MDNGLFMYDNFYMFIYQQKRVPYNEYLVLDRAIDIAQTVYQFPCGSVYKRIIFPLRPSFQQQIGDVILVPK